MSAKIKTIIYDSKGKELTRCSSIREASEFIGYGHHLSGDQYDSIKRHRIAKVSDFFIGVFIADKEEYLSHQSYIRRGLLARKSANLRLKKRLFLLGGIKFFIKDIVECLF